MELNQKYGREELKIFIDSLSQYFGLVLRFLIRCVCVFICFCVHVGGIQYIGIIIYIYFSLLFINLFYKLSTFIIL